MAALAAVAALVAVAAVAGVGCSPRVLVVVDPCGDAGGQGCPGPPPNPLLEGLVGWWRFDDGAGSTTVRDMSGQSPPNEGILVDVDGADPLSWPPGRSGDSLELGGRGYVLVPRSASIDAIVGQVTVTAWIEFEGSIGTGTSAPDYGTAVSRQIGSGDGLLQYYHLSLDIQARPNLLIAPVRSGAQLTAMTSLPRFKWTHLAGTYDGTTASLYVDGLLVASFPLAGGAFAQDTTPLVLGGNANGSLGITERFPGRIDEIMLYNRGLKADEISRLWQGDLP